MIWFQAVVRIVTSTKHTVYLSKMLSALLSLVFPYRCYLPNFGKNH